MTWRHLAWFGEIPGFGKYFRTSGLGVIFPGQPGKFRAPGRSAIDGLGIMWNVIVSVPDHCHFIYFALRFGCSAFRLLTETGNYRNIERKLRLCRLRNLTHSYLAFHFWDPGLTVQTEIRRHRTQNAASDQCLHCLLNTEMSIKINSKWKTHQSPLKWRMDSST